MFEQNLRIPLNASLEIETDETPSVRDQVVEDLQRYQELFGAENGAKWFGEGLTLSQAWQRHTEQLQRERDTLKAKLASLEGKLTAIGHED